MRRVRRQLMNEPSAKKERIMAERKEKHIGIKGFKMKSMKIRRQLKVFKTKMQNCLISRNAGSGLRTTLS